MSDRRELIATAHHGFASTLLVAAAVLALLLPAGCYLSHERDARDASFRDAPPLVRADAATPDAPDAPACAPPVDGWAPLEATYDGDWTALRSARADGTTWLVASPADRARPLELLGFDASAPPAVRSDVALAGTERAAEVGGVNVHAKVAVGAHDHPRRERVCRYLLRPPLAQDRLTLESDGRVRIALKAAWKDGTDAVLLDPRPHREALCSRPPAALPPAALPRRARRALGRACSRRAGARATELSHAAAARPCGFSGGFSEGPQRAGQSPAPQRAVRPQASAEERTRRT